MNGMCPWHILRFSIKQAAFLRQLFCFCGGINMQDSLNYIAAGKMLLDAVSPVDTERVPLDKCSGRVLAKELVSAANVPPFDRSAYDGYALRAEDTAAASKAVPVLLRIVEEIPAGSVPTVVLTKGTAAKILTGAPIPSGADAVIMFEKTRFTKEAVEIFAPLKSGDNIVLAGEDVREGELLAKAGEVIDPGLAGTLAAQGVTRPAVYRVPRVAVISTGSEVLEAEEEPSAGKIRNSNRYMLDAAIRALGCEPVYLGTAGDSVEDICALIEGGLESCDALVSTGGVSVGDYD